MDGASKTYRHAVGATAKRGDYYYTLTCSAPERLWPDLEGPYKQAVASFRLTQPTSAYRDPSTPGLAFW